jgi:hypothetical protein
MGKIEDQILSTEYCEDFDVKRKNRMITSFYKYGPVKIDYGEGLIESIPTLEKCLQKYKDTGNTEYLVDMANYAMIEYMYPQHKNAHFSATDSKESAGIVGISVRQLEEFDSQK